MENKAAEKEHKEPPGMGEGFRGNRGGQGQSGGKATVSRGLKEGRVSRAMTQLEVPGSRVAATPPGLPRIPLELQAGFEQIKSSDNGRPTPGTEYASSSPVSRRFRMSRAERASFPNLLWPLCLCVGPEGYVGLDLSFAECPNFSFCFCFFRAAPAAYGCPQARG